MCVCVCVCINVYIHIYSICICICVHGWVWMDGYVTFESRHRNFVYNMCHCIHIQVTIKIILSYLHILKKAFLKILFKRVQVTVQWCAKSEKNSMTLQQRRLWYCRSDTSSSVSHGINMFQESICTTSDRF